MSDVFDELQRERDDTSVEDLLRIQKEIDALFAERREIEKRFQEAQDRYLQAYRAASKEAVYRFANHPQMLSRG